MGTRRVLLGAGLAMSLCAAPAMTALATEAEHSTGTITDLVSPDTIPG
jgi:hypothetical protein